MLRRLLTPTDPLSRSGVACCFDFDFKYDLFPTDMSSKPSSALRHVQFLLLTRANLSVSLFLLATNLLASEQTPPPVNSIPTTLTIVQALMQPWTPSSLVYHPPEHPSPRLQTVLEFIEASNEWSSARHIQRVMDLFDENLEHRILPKSLARPVLNKKQYGEYLVGLMGWIKSLKMTLHEVVEGEDTIVIHTSTAGEGLNGTSFAGEEMITFHFTPPKRSEELPKISFVKEFVDSQSTYQFFLEERRKTEHKRQSSSTQP
ncbi:hypothetical protein V5O48_007150 [Marasmius crinis-equi]|uniref:SnoaL-like domain-containing protein n=1 Tax=Marasmius crinis-equi TaxID=585013 RepID=A0ABR3FHI1_9AGAR